MLLNSLGLLTLLILSIPLGRAKERGRVGWMKWIPSLRFVRLMLVDLLVREILAFIGYDLRDLPGGLYKEFNDFLFLSYCLAAYDVLIDYLWLLYVRFVGPANAPPKILQDTIFAIGLALIIG
ncbi:MAG: hypothetical protein RLZZ11_585, partial [Cyanobacteriota bacterium]